MNLFCKGEADTRIEKNQLVIAYEGVVYPFTKYAADLFIGRALNSVDGGKEVEVLVENYGKVNTVIGNVL